MFYGKKIKNSDFGPEVAMTEFEQNRNQTKKAKITTTFTCVNKNIRKIWKLTI